MTAGRCRHRVDTSAGSRLLDRELPLEDREENTLFG